MAKNNSEAATGAPSKRAAVSATVVTVATTGALLLLRKGLAAGWTKATGRKPPTDPRDPAIGLPETLAWAVATGVIVETARFAIVRATARWMPPGGGENPAS